ncbi:MAG: lipoprotein signal peptidase [Bacteroidota bacterium]|jgi:signal peptidase II
MNNRKKIIIQSTALMLAVVLIDQLSKLYIKTHFFLGEEIHVMGNWFRLHFTENYGMAFGIELGGEYGKLLLTFFRIAAVGVIGWFIVKMSSDSLQQKFVLPWTLILAGAIGNIIDSVFYGVWFGYDTWFHGRVVDMFYFPLIQTTLPENFPIWPGEEFEFFRPVFNVADAAISIGFVLVLVLQSELFGSSRNQQKAENSETTEESQG